VKVSNQALKKESISSSVHTSPHDKNLKIKKKISKGKPRLEGGEEGRRNMVGGGGTKRSSVEAAGGSRNIMRISRYLQEGRGNRNGHKVFVDRPWSGLVGSTSVAITRNEVGSNRKKRNKKNHDNNRVPQAKRERVC